MPLDAPHAPVEGGGSVIWLLGGPSVGKSSIARAIQATGSAHDAWVLAGDQHLLRVIATSLIRHGVAVDDDWPGWTVPFEDGRVIGVPRAGPVAVRLLDGMYRAAAAMAAAGNNVVLEDVVWDASIADLARAAFAGIDLFAVRVFCPIAMAITREHARSDRFDGAVVAFAAQPELNIDVAMKIDTSDLDRFSCARQVLDRFERRRLGGPAA